MFHPLRTAAAVLALGAALAAPAMAQTAGVSTDPAGESAGEGAYSDAQLTSFVEAVLAVAAVRQQYMAPMQQAADDAERQRLAEEARQEMQAAVAGTEGIDLETYNAIGEAAQADAELNDRIVAIAQAMAPGEGPAGTSIDESDG